eukprot:sb/3477326/
MQQICLITPILAVAISEISSVQMGQKTESFRSALVDYPSSRCFSIILRDNTSIDLVALVPNEAYVWVKGLRCLVTGGLGKLSLKRYTSSAEAFHAKLSTLPRVTRDATY